MTGGGFSLEDHWNQGDARAARSRKEDGTTSSSSRGRPRRQSGRHSLLRDARRFAADSSPRLGAKPALYMVWPPASRRQDFGGVSDSNRLAAKDVDGLLLPAGKAWRSVGRTAPSFCSIRLTGCIRRPAGWHLAGAVIYARLDGLAGTPRADDASFRRRGGGPHHARLLQQAAAEAASLPRGK